MLMKILLVSLMAICALMGCATVTPGQVSSDNNNLDMTMHSGMTAYRDGRLGDAETLFLKAIETHPSLSEAWFRLGNIYYRTGRYDAAVRSYEHTLRYDNQNGRAWFNLSLTRLKQADTVLQVGQRTLKADAEFYDKLDSLRIKLNARVDQGGG